MHKITILIITQSILKRRDAGVREMSMRAFPAQVRICAIFPFRRLFIKINALYASLSVSAVSSETDAVFLSRQNIKSLKSSIIISPGDHIRRFIIRTGIIVIYYFTQLVIIHPVHSVYIILTWLHRSQN